MLIKQIENQTISFVPRVKEAHVITELIATLLQGLQTLYLIFQYYLNTALSPSNRERRTLFQDGMIEKAENFGKRADIEAFVQSTHLSSEFETVLKRRGFTAPKEITPTPFGGGVCLGSCLVFAKNYLSTGNVEETASKFKEGAPQEAILLQAGFEAIGSYEYDKTLKNLLTNMLEGYKKAPNKTRFLKRFERRFFSRYSARHEENNIIFYATCAFLAVKQQKSYLDYILEALRAENIVPTGKCYASLRLASYCNNGDETAYRNDIMKAATDLAHLNCLEPHFFQEKPLKNWSDGVYLFKTPVRSCLGLMHEGFHALLMIKKEGRYTLFDPNYGTGSTSEGETLLERAFSKYFGNKESLKATLSVYRLEA